jgi:hypothetical protein
MESAEDLQLERYVGAKRDVPRDGDVMICKEMQASAVLPHPAASQCELSPALSSHQSLE